MTEAQAAAQSSQLDPQLFASLLPSLAQLYQLTSCGLDASRQLEIARLAGTIRQALEQAKQQAEDIPGGDLSIQDQEELIAILEREVAKRRSVHLRGREPSTEHQPDQ